MKPPPRKGIETTAKFAEYAEFQQVSPNFADELSEFGKQKILEAFTIHSLSDLASQTAPIKTRGTERWWSLLADLAWKLNSNLGVIDNEQAS